MFKKRQIVVLALILVIIVAGYLQYTYKSSSAPTGSKDGKIGEAIFVDSRDGSDDSASNGTGVLDDTADTATRQTASIDERSDFFAQAKLDRETSRSRNIEMLRTITVDENAAQDVKTDAYGKIMALSDRIEAEMKIETLVKEKGYEDAIVLFADDGSIDIIVKSPGLTASESTQIADIVSRQAKVGMEFIHLRNNL